ncbi:MAG: glycerate kinase [Bacilli bacterium]|nr:glycerate kinase [Bacilli bacterium]
MKRFILIPDSFKGTLSSIQVCDIIEEEIIKELPKASIKKIPVADGGEGSVDAFLSAVGGKKVFLEVAGPYFERMISFYGLIDNGQTAIIEMAACCGLPLVEGRKDPSLTTTYGVGELIKAAVGQGVKKIILGLGGSATNDGGCGCAAALGVRFFNENFEEFIPVGISLDKIKKIAISHLDVDLRNIEIITICDIDNPLYGKNGAAYVFAPQKGANQEMVAHLDNNLQALALIVEKDLDFSDWNFRGAGAAGGMGYGMKVFLDSKIQMGIETVLDVVGFDELINGVDYVITGEGKLDYQSLRGKVVIGVARRAKKKNVKVLAVVGSLAEGYEGAYDEGVDKIIETNYLHLPFEEVKPRAEADLRKTIAEFIQTLKRSN